MSSHPLTNFKIQKCYQNEPKFKVAYSRNNLPKVEDVEYVTNLDKHESVGAHWIALYANGDNVAYLDSSGVEYIPKKLKSSQKTKISEQITTE